MTEIFDFNHPLPNYFFGWAPICEELCQPICLHFKTEILNQLLSYYIHFSGPILGKGLKKLTK